MINYQLVLTAEKQGGTDERGAYTGTAHLTANFDASQMSQELLKVMGGFNIDITASPLTFDVVAYSMEDYSDFGVKEDEVGLLAPLVQYDSMSLVNAPFSGSGSLDVLVQDIQGQEGQAKTDFSGIAPIPMKIAIVGGQVTVTIESMELSDCSFMGMVVGTPVK
ncbi:MAG: hypothetical protein ABFC62_06275 [Clostridiaceae bacterium]|nr:hypothetical protein [Eubacteriales bacterium]